MDEPYRSWEDRRQIIRAVIADSNPKPLSDFNLTESELAYYTARSARAVDALARQASAFKTYYALPTARPFLRVAIVAGMAITACVAAGTYVFIHTRDEPAYPVFAALISVAAIAAGWWVIGGMAHINAVRQNTQNLLFARFSQAPFSDAMHRFHHAFGYDVTAKVTREQVIELRDSGCQEKLKAAASVAYLLNYFEFIASGVICGDLNRNIINNNIRGLIIYYYDKCEPYIRDAKRVNPRIYEHLVKIRTHYREP